MRSLHHLPKSAVAVVALAGSLGLAAAGSTVASAAQPAGRFKVANAQPSLASATATGKTSSSQRISVRLYLADQNAAELESKVKAVSTPGTGSYAKYLTPATYRARYAPSAASVNSVRKFVTGAGLSVSAVPDNHLYVEATGTVAKVAKAFGTSLKNYQLSGQTVRAAASAPTIPTALKGTVIAVSGLASTSTLMTPDHEDGAKVKGSTAALKTAAKKATRTSTHAAPPPAAFVNATPCSTYFGQKVATSAPKAFGTKAPYAPCGYTPAQLQGAYGLTSSIKKGFDGSGVTVAIVDAYAAPTVLSDANTYATKHGQAAFTKTQFKQTLPKQGFRYGYDDTVNGDQCGEQGWYGEETLDVESVHAVAPGAKINYVASPSCDNGDFADTLNNIVDKHLASIVTNSWGGTDETNGSPELDQVYQQIFFQAALQGIGFYFSSGDNGDGSAVNGGVPSPEAPANSQLVTAVGGTSLAVGKNNQRLYETGWSTAKSTLTNGAWTPAAPGTYLYGAGGGTSQVYAQPWYQQGVVPSSLSKRYSSQPGRVVPDVSAIADPNTGFLVGETQTFPNGKAKYSEYRIGGTSLASPTFAGIMSIADQVAGFAHGFANPALYSLYGSKALYDPKPVSNRGVVRVDFVNGVDATGGLATSLRSIDVAETGTILRTRTGYDDITGIGSPNGISFLGKLS